VQGFFDFEIQKNEYAQSPQNENKIHKRILVYIALDLLIGYSHLNRFIVA